MVLRVIEFAAGDLILREAGGIVSDFMGETGYVKSGNLVSGNPKMLRALLKICDVQNLPAILK